MTTETTTEKTTKKPSYIAYQVREGSNDESYWTRVGVAFSHKDGKGFNIQVQSVPLDGRITLRVPTEKKQ
jgi:hypothetical protein